MRPFSQACENNKQPILAVLRRWLSTVESVLELGSGTGQHARYFAESLPDLVWQPSDLAQNHAAINAWRDGYAGDNLPAPLAIDVTDRDWGVALPGALFTANSLHIMPWSAVEALFAYLGEHAPDRSLLLVYGPFNYDGAYTSDSNARFDQWLAAEHPGGGIRDFEAVDGLAREAGYQLQEDNPMPANNRLLVWRKSA
ncbi:MAG: DUF938 domain-containing protein [Halieaceae bacterium]|jgi:hypothetical protein|nr:DUF938 domain-containing protein [Halieaceae bacterium]